MVTFKSEMLGVCLIMLPFVLYVLYLILRVKYNA